MTDRFVRVLNMPFSSAEAAEASAAGRKAPDHGCGSRGNSVEMHRVSLGQEASVSSYLTGFPAIIRASKFSPSQVSDVLMLVQSRETKIRTHLAAHPIH